MKTEIIKSEMRSSMEILSVSKYREIESGDNVVVNVSMFFDPIDEKHTTVISYH